MPRIVKAGAKELTVVQVDGDKVFLKADTIEIEKGWRPEDYVNIKETTLGCKFCDKIKVDCGACQCSIGFEAGFDACIEAMEKL